MSKVTAFVVATVASVIWMSACQSVGGADQEGYLSGAREVAPSLQDANDSVLLDAGNQVCSTLDQGEGPAAELLVDQLFSLRADSWSGKELRGIWKSASINLCPQHEDTVRQMQELGN